MAGGARQSACHCSRDKNGGFDSIFQVLWGLGLRSKEYAQSAAAAHGAHISLLFALHSFLYATATYSSVRTGLPIPLFDVAGSIWLNHAERPARGRATLSSLAVLLGRPPATSRLSASHAIDLMQCSGVRSVQSAQSRPVG